MSDFFTHCIPAEAPAKSTSPSLRTSPRIETATALACVPEIGDAQTHVKIMLAIRMRILSSVSDQ